jgi:prefoldin subunit 5
MSRQNGEIFNRIFTELSLHSEILKEHSNILRENIEIFREHTNVLREQTNGLKEHTDVLQQLVNIAGKHTEILEEFGWRLAGNLQKLKELMDILARFIDYVKEIKEKFDEMNLRLDRAVISYGDEIVIQFEDGTQIRGRLIRSNKK